MLDMPVILLNPVVQVPIVSMESFTANDPSNGLCIRRMLISSEAQWLPVRTVKKSAEEPTSCMLITLLAEH
ncbi:MAG: hypothetical protein O3C10_06450, partial [Chloroflexi bacterium]|nr:hypothetical protein [Chloroflexota bacterium]